MNKKFKLIGAALGVVVLGAASVAAQQRRPHVAYDVADARYASGSGFPSAHAATHAEQHARPFGGARRSRRPVRWRRNEGRKNLRGSIGPPIGGRRGWQSEGRRENDRWGTWRRRWPSTCRKTCARLATPCTSFRRASSRPRRPRCNRVAIRRAGRPFAGHAELRRLP